MSGPFPIYSRLKAKFETIQRGHRWMGYRAPMKIELNIHLAHDEEADVWYVAASDIPGLFLEADTPQGLIARLADAAPEMIELNIAEILRNYEGARDRETPKVSLRPVFDSPLELAHV